LEGKLANLAEETPNQRMMDSSTLKNLISGGIMQVRQLYKSPYFTKSRAKMIFACNDLPDGEDVTKAYLRRLIIVPFKATFDMEHGNVDPFIEEKLKEEFAGIFNLAISHYDNLCKSKQFTHSNKIDETMREYANYLDPLKDWVDEKINFYPVGNGCDEKVVSMRKLYDEYAIAMEQDNIRPLPRKKFTIQLRRKVPEFDARYASKRVDGKKERILKAISLETDG
jgi:putative DNA primase/helicase